MITFGFDFDISKCGSYRVYSVTPKGPVSAFISDNEFWTKSLLSIAIDKGQDMWFDDQELNGDATHNLKEWVDGLHIFLQRLRNEMNKDHVRR